LPSRCSSSPEASFDRRVRQAVRLIAQTRLASHGSRPRLEDAVRRARWWRDAWFTEAALLAITIAFLVNGIRSDVGGELSTWRTAGGHRTLAGWWYAAVSLPLFQFLVWRWCARLLIWWQLLWRIAGSISGLIPTHPDRVGGLGILGVAHLTLARSYSAPRRCSSRATASNCCSARPPSSSSHSSRRGDRGGTCLIMRRC